MGLNSASSAHKQIEITRSVATTQVWFDKPGSPHKEWMAYVIRPKRHSARVDYGISDQGPKF